MNKIKHFLALSFLPALLWSQMVHASTSPERPLTVSIKNEEILLQFKQPVRLNDVIINAEANGVVISYPLASSLVDESDSTRSKLNQLKVSVLNRMMQKNLTSSQFYKFIKKSRFDKKVIPAIDFDKVRLEDKNNPLLNGQYGLVTPRRDEHVFFLGDIDTSAWVVNTSSKPLSAMLESLETELGEKTPDPILIYPDGNVVTPKLGIWSTSRYYLPPLTMVYFPFDDSELDNDIIQLLTQVRFD